MKIGEKLSKLQQDMKVPKDQYNKFGKFYYRNAETILAEFKKYEKDLKVFLTLKDEIVEVVGKVYIKATATLHLRNLQNRMYLRMRSKNLRRKSRRAQINISKKLMRQWMQRAKKS